MARTIEELKHLVLSFDHEDINTLFIEESVIRNISNVKFENHEYYFGEDVVFITGQGVVTANEFGGGEEPEYTEHEVDFDVIISSNDNEGNEVKASFCTQYETPKKL